MSLPVHKATVFCLKWLLYTLVGLIADALDAIVPFKKLDVRPALSMAPSDIDHLSDKEIIDQLLDAPSLPGQGNRLRRLTPGTIIKIGQDSGRNLSDAAEANALNLVFSESTIPVPRVRRVIKEGRYFVIVMDYIPGPTLAKAWPTLSTWHKIGIAWTLRRYVRQLRRLKASDTTPPGPISRDGPRDCESPLFGRVRSCRGPFSSYLELSDFFNKRHKMTADAKNIPLDDPSRKEKFDDSGALVLTHQDLNHRNMILGDDGRLWIVDWAWSGYYPPWFEYVAMQEQNPLDHISGTNDKFWKMLVPFISGPYFRQERWRWSMAQSLDTL